MTRARRPLLTLLLSATLGFGAACGASDSTFLPEGSSSSGEPGTSGSSGPGGFGTSNGSTDTDGSGSNIQSLVIDPAVVTLSVVQGQPLPTAQFRALGDGQPVRAGWTLDRGELGSINQEGSFVASGALGGTGTIIATVGNLQATAKVVLDLRMEQNGGVASDAGGGAGGRGGVGGDSEGGAVDAATRAVLMGAATAAPGLIWLYPYDQTVFPRGILAPQLQWRDGATSNFDAVRIDVEETHFAWTGTFARNAPTFKNHPLPADVWRTATRSNEGEDLVVRLTFAKGGVAYGPIEERWKISASPLKGIVYYNSYGTSLAKNFDGAIQSPGGAFPGGKFGGATLSIHGDSTDPALVAGGNGGGDQCYVCHTVSLDGSRLLTHYQGDANQSSFDLSTGTETKIPRSNTSATYTWPGPSPDGKYFLSDMHGPSKLHRVPEGGGSADAVVQPSSGLPNDLSMAFPTFSPSGTAVAFNRYGGAGSDKRTLAMVSFDAATFTFGPIDNLFTVDAGQHPVWPSFLPGGGGLLYELAVRPNDRAGIENFGGNRSNNECEGDTNAAAYKCGPNTDKGTRAEIWMFNLATRERVRLDRLNGKDRNPTGGYAHNDDSTLNYEPAASPVVSGGYAWVVFTSRRLYGNIATINPWWSDPRFKDISLQPTTKKLWVAAIDLNAPPGEDPSHPAFYLPAQELMAGNSRGFWVVDPCRADGNGCESGDECCGGYCRPGESGALVCSNAINTCANEFENCEADADCCGSTLQCIEGRCGKKSPSGPN